MKKQNLAALLAAAFMLVFSVNVAANSTGTSIYAGNGIAGAITEDGSLMMWGNNEYGEFGNGETGHPEGGKKAEFIKTNSDVRQVAFGTYASAIILKNDGTVWTSGRNDSYQAGDGTNVNKTTPVKVMDNAVLVGAGSEYMLVLKADGTLWGWGASRPLGQEGSAVKTPVKIYDNVRYFSCGADFCAVITTDNKLYTAGNGAHGNLGTGEAGMTFKPGFNYVMDNVKTVSCGKQNMLIVDNNGALWSCGSNSYGQLLNGTTGEKVVTPQKVIESGVKSATTYENDSLYITENGELFAAGNNLYGQFGLGWSMTNQGSDGKPVPPGTVYKIADNVTDASIGFQNMMWRTSDGVLYMSGSNVTQWGLAFNGSEPVLENIAANAEITTTPDITEKKITLQIGSDKLINNGVETILDVPAQTINDRTMVPLRAIFEALGASVEWDGETQTVTSVRDDITVTLQINSNKIYKNSESKELDVPAQLVDGRTLVPVRAIAEAFNCEVAWEGETKTVIITE